MVKCWKSIMSKNVGSDDHKKSNWTLVCVCVRESECVDLFIHHAVYFPKSIQFLSSHPHSVLSILCTVDIRGLSTSTPIWSWHRPPVDTVLTNSQRVSLRCHCPLWRSLCIRHPVENVIELLLFRMMEDSSIQCRWWSYSLHLVDAVSTTHRPTAKKVKNWNCVKTVMIFSQIIGNIIIYCSLIKRLITPSCYTCEATADHKDWK